MYRAAVLLAVVVWCMCGDVGIHAARVIRCDSDQTLSKSWFAYEHRGRSCRELVADLPDHYNPYLINDCKRWMGPAHAEYVEDYFVTSCEELSNGSLKYKADVCCSGPTVMRCFDCNEKSAHKCRASASAVTCSEGQVCKTTVSYDGFYPNTKTSRRTGCADASVCENAQIDNTNTCKDWLTNPECTVCCNTPYCNQYTPAEPDVYVGDTPCLSEPCQNGATCEYVPNAEMAYTCTCTAEYTGEYCTECAVDPCEPINPCDNGGVCMSLCVSYECRCRVGWTGDHCQQSLPVCSNDIDICQNGGTCYDHGPFGLRCKCPEKFLGTYCEIAMTECSVPEARREARYLRMRRNTDCSEEFVKVEASPENDNSLSLCASHMSRIFKKQEFREKKDGLVLNVELQTSVTCDKGDTFTFTRMSWCCPSCYSMPCQNNGWCTQTEDNDYHCQCRHGWFGKHCEQRRHSCVITGDPHYTTFDGAHFSYQGNRSFKLIELNGIFTVTSTNERIGSVSYLYSVTISTCGHVVELNRDQQVSVDGVPVDPADYLTIDCIRISLDGNRVKVETSDGLVVDSDGAYTAIIYLPFDLMGKVQGLCGNFDSNPDDDWTGSNGMNYFDYPNRDFLVAKSWTIDNSDTDPEVSPNLNCTDIDIDSYEYCGHLLDLEGVFRECMAAPAVNHLEDAADCRYDVCANKPNGVTAMKKAACDAMQTLMFKCEDEGHIIGWRDVTGCPLICKEGFTYSDSAPACPATCRMPDAPATCELPNKESCVCSEGTLLKNGECIEPAECGCIDDHGNSFEVGDTWLSGECDLSYTCIQSDTRPQPSIEEGAGNSCGDGTICSSTTRGVGTCIPYTNPCNAEPCSNGGECETTGLDYVCRCRAGWYGKRCRAARPLCANGTVFCENGGTCYDHGRFGLRCKCLTGFVGTTCEFPILTCSNPALHRLGGEIYLEIASGNGKAEKRNGRNQNGRTCSSEIARIQSMLNIDRVLYFCKRFVSRKLRIPQYVDGPNGDITEVESRSFRTCEMGDTHLFAVYDWCCPSCYALPCMNGGSCTQERDGHYTCNCIPGWTGTNCEIGVPLVAENELGIP